MKRLYFLSLLLLATLFPFSTHNFRLSTCSAQSTSGKVYVGYAKYSDQIWEYDGLSLDHNAQVGCAVLLTIPLERGLERLPPILGLVLCFGLFLLFRHVDAGFLGPFRLPEGLYRFRPLAPLGFPDPLFRSSDYFPLLPWYFLFLCGWFLGKLFRKNKGWQTAATVRIPLLSALGRKTVWVYLLHQPVLMGICMLLFGR
jgi:hypothetical protein